MYCYCSILLYGDSGLLIVVRLVFVFKQKTAYEMRISDWSSDVCSSDLNSARTLIFLFTLAILATLNHACHCPFHFTACARFPGADIPSSTQPAARNVSPLSQGMRWQCQGA